MKDFLKILCIVLLIVNGNKVLLKSIKSKRQRAFSFFSNPIDSADAESYGTTLFNYLSKYLTDIKQQQLQCKQIPLPKTVLNQKYFNPNYNLRTYKYWFPPKDNQYLIVYSQLESYRNALFLSYLLQNENAKFPPGWLYMYLSTAAQLHSLQMIGQNSHKAIKAIKLPFESNEVFKVNWYTSGNYQKFDKPFALYATKTRNNDPRFIKVTDFGVGDFTNDYTGHAFLGTYMYAQQQYLLNNTYESSNNWIRPLQPQQQHQPYQQQQQEQQHQPNLQYQQQAQGQQQPYLQHPSQDYNFNKDSLYPQQPLSQQQQLNKQSLSDLLKDSMFLTPNSIPFKEWDPLIDNDKTNFNNRLNDNELKYGFDRWYSNQIAKNNEFYRKANPNYLNPFALPNIKYVDSYRFAKNWWNNETAFTNDKQDYLFRIKPEDKFYKFIGPKLEGGIGWTSPYFWCFDPTNWLVSAKTSIWASNDFEYRNKIFLSYEQQRFVGLSEVVLNYEEVNIEQCPGDRQYNVFASTALCDTTSECIPISGFGLTQGGYECHCSSNHRYPINVEGPFQGKELLNRKRNQYPLCIRSEGLLQYPNWIRRIQLSNDQTYRQFDGTLTDLNYNMNLNMRKDQNYVNAPEDHLIFRYNDRIIVKKKRFIDKRNNFERLRDAIFSFEPQFKRQCYSQYNQDVIQLFDDDERYTTNLRAHVNDAFRPQIAQAIRVAHILSSYIQLHIPYGTSSLAGNQYDSFNTFANTIGSNMRQDPQLEEHIVIAELMSTLNAHYPILEANVFFNGTEYGRQKLYSSQNTLAFGLSMYRVGGGDQEVSLNRSNDDSHLTKSWYKDAISRYTFGGKSDGKTDLNGGEFQANYEKNFFENPSQFDLNSQTYKIDRYSIEMDVRRNFDGSSGTVTLPIKFYDAASSGVWFGPFYDCQKKSIIPSSSLRMSYSVPIITSSAKRPVGFVSIVVGSDLKWWKINPCDTSNTRNMFQYLHKCDAESTVCINQDIPEYENGFYLSSYKCVCRKNYELPFADMGTSYFEGATMEKEYEKKLKGETNIFDRLKCRPVLKARRHETADYSGSKQHTYSILSYILLFSIIVNS